MTLRKRFFNYLERAVLDDQLRYRVQYLGTFLLLATVSLVMTVVNIFTSKYTLMTVTAVFAVLSYLNALFVKFGGKWYSLSKLLFSVEILALLTYFIVSGNPEGFSALWSLMLPSLGLLLLGKERGSVLAGILFLVIAFFFWIPAGKALLPEGIYTASFMLRFPFIYIAFLFLGSLFESIRYLTFKNYRQAITHDPMTNALNRKGLDEFIIKHCKESKEVGFFIFDVDHFKTFNDTYGHKFGDRVLIECVQVISEVFPYPLCRWGGDEFVAIIPDADITEETLAKIPEAVRNHVFEYEGQKVQCTISLGAVIAGCENGVDFTELCHEADKSLYEIKDSSRDGYLLRRV